MQAYLMLRNSNLNSNKDMIIILSQTVILTLKETQWNKSFSATTSVKRLLFSLTDSKEALTVTVSFRWLRRRQPFSGILVRSREGTSTMYCLGLGESS